MDSSVGGTLERAPVLEAVATFRRLGDRFGERDALGWLARVANLGGDQDQALVDIRAAQALADELPDVSARNEALMQLTHIHVARDEPGPALRGASTMLDEARRRGLRRDVHMALRNLARLAIEYQGAERAVIRAITGDLAGATADLATADELFAPWSRHRLTGTKIELCRAWVAFAAGDVETARVLGAAVRAQVERRGLGPTTVLGARLAAFERASSR